MGCTLWRASCIHVGIIDSADLSPHLLGAYDDLAVLYYVLLYFLNDPMVLCMTRRVLCIIKYHIVMMMSASMANVFGYRRVGIQQINKRLNLYRT